MRKEWIPTTKCMHGWTSVTYGCSSRWSLCKTRYGAVAPSPWPCRTSSSCRSPARSCSGPYALGAAARHWIQSLCWRFPSLQLPIISLTKAITSSSVISPGLNCWHLIAHVVFSGADHAAPTCTTSLLGPGDEQLRKTPWVVTSFLSPAAFWSSVWPDLQMVGTEETFWIRVSWEFGISEDEKPWRRAGGTFLSAGADLWV